MASKTLRVPGLGDTGLPTVPLLFLLIIPLAGSLILGTMFSEKLVSQVPTAVWDRDNSRLSRSLDTMISENDTFRVVAQPENQQEMEDLLVSGKVAAAILIPPGFEADLSRGTATKVEVFYDGTALSMTGAVRAKISEVLGTIRTGYILQVAEGRLGITPAKAKADFLPFSYTTRFLGNPTKNTQNAMVDGMLLNITQVAVFMLGIALVTGAPRKRDLLFRIGLASLAGCWTVFAALFSQNWIFHVPFRGSVPASIALTIPFIIGTTALGATLRLLLGDRDKAVGLGALLTATFLFSGYSYPVMAMPAFYQAPEKILPFYHFGLPMRDIGLLGAGFPHVWGDISWLCLFAAMFLVTGTLLLGKTVRTKGVPL